MTGVLQAPPTTALYDRLEREGRLLEDSEATTNFSPPNFRTTLPPDVLLGGLRQMLLDLYDPARFFAARSGRSSAGSRNRRSTRRLRRFCTACGCCSRPCSFRACCRTTGASTWRFVRDAVRQWRGDQLRWWKATALILSAHHFLQYARDAAAELDAQVRLSARADAQRPPVEAC